MADTRIVDQDVEPTFGSSKSLYRSSDLGLVGYIELLYASAAPSGPNFTGNLLRCIFSNIGENNVRSLPREEPRDMLSNARSGSRHEGDLLI